MAACYFSNCAGTSARKYNAQFLRKGGRRRRRVRALQYRIVMRWFLSLCGAVAAERIAELAWSRGHERRMAARGGAVVGEPWYAVMVALHAGTLVAAPIEAWLRGGP